MQHLKDLAAAGYKHGYTNGHGADDTVSSLEWALQHLEGSPGTAATYSQGAIYSLEARLFSAYVISSLAAVKSGNLEFAKAEYDRAATIAKMTDKGPGKIPSIDPVRVEETLALVERRLRQSGVTV